MDRYVTSDDMDVWCERTIEEAPHSSLKTAAEHLLLSNRNAKRALEVERSVTAELRAEAHQLGVNLHLERDRIATLEARLAEVERDRDSVRETNAAMDRGIESIAVALGATGADLGLDYDALVNMAKNLRARLARIEAAAREVARGDHDECHVCLEWGRCPRCTGSLETANRAKCDRCEIRAALDLPVVVRTCCYRCHQWSEVRARFDDHHRREWLCASCRAALDEKEVG